MADMNFVGESLKSTTSTSVTYLEILTRIAEKSQLTSLNLTDSSQKDVILNFICEKFGIEIEQISKSDLNQLNQSISTFFSHFVRKYKEPIYSRKIKNIMSDDWSSLCLSLPSSFTNQLNRQSFSFQPDDIPSRATENIPTAQTSIQIKGRRGKLFEEKKARAQMKDSSSLRNKFSPGVINLANKQNLSMSGQKDAAFVVKRISSETGSTARFARAAILSRNELSSRPVSKKTPEEALFFLLTNNLTKEQYCNMKQACKESGADIWPAYTYVQGAKPGLEPEEVNVTENEAVVPLQDLLNHTVKRIFVSNLSLSQQMENLAEENGGSLEATLIYKIGFDSSGSHTISQQTNSDGEHRQIKSLMTSQMAPLKLVTVVEGEEICLLDYPGQNSPHSCRPLRLAFEKETNETTEKEFQGLRKEMEEIKDYLINENPKVSVSFSGLFTMIDGKVLCSITGAKTTQCPLCHCNGKDLAKNEGPFVVKSINFLKFGASPLHFGLRAFSTLLHIGYKQDFKQHRVTKENSSKFQARKLKVKRAFRRELNLIVDSSSGPGNTLSGNVARKAFSNPIKFTQIIGVSPMLVSNFDVIWQTLASKLPIKSANFETFCFETLELYMSEVGWFNLSPTLHKILIHGRDIIEACPVPIGLTSEENSESNNKLIRKYLLHHTRKT